MTPGQIELVERSVAELAPVLDDVVADFYAALFATDPAIEALFVLDGERSPDGVDADPARFAAQREKFAAQLADIMTAVRDHPRFLAGAEDLGARHAGYGVRAGHYDVVGQVLLDVLAVHLGDRWSPALADAWRLAYNLTAEAMLAGAARAPAAPSGAVELTGRSDDGPVS
jgi:hemoglobin-like flavoprotein